MPSMIQIYRCDICAKEYREHRAALRCEQRGMLPCRLKVGDIVFAGAGFGWFDGDKRWVSNPNARRDRNPKHGNCFGPCCTYQFYYVVTAIDRDPKDGHRHRYHVATGAMRGGYYGGHTFETGHEHAVLASCPPTYVKRAGKKLIGETFDRLL